MAKVEKNLVLEGLSGMIGRQLVIRRRPDGSYVVSSRPHFVGDRPPTEAQAKQREKFREAVEYAKSAKELEAYKSEAQSRGISAFNVAAADFLHPPEIKAIDMASYDGNTGDKITITAQDDVLVKEVGVAILGAENKLVGRVIFEGTNEPLRNQQVLILPEEGDPRDITTDNEGVFKMGGFKPIGHSYLYAVAYGYMISPAIIENLDSANVSSGVVIEVRTEGGMLSGKLTSSKDGSAVANGFVVVGRKDFFGLATTNSNGEYQIKGIEDGTYKVTAVGAGLQQTVVEDIGVSSNASNVVNLSRDQQAVASSPGVSSNVVNISLNTDAGNGSSCCNPQCCDDEYNAVSAKCDAVSKTCEDSYKSCYDLLHDLLLDAVLDFNLKCALCLLRIPGCQEKTVCITDCISSCSDIPASTIQHAINCFVDTFNDCQQKNASCKSVAAAALTACKLQATGCIIKNPLGD